MRGRGALAEDGAERDREVPAAGPSSVSSTPSSVDSRAAAGVHATVTFSGDQALASFGVQPPGAARLADPGLSALTRPAPASADVEAASEVPVAAGSELPRVPAEELGDGAEHAALDEELLVAVLALLQAQESHDRQPEER